MPTKVTPNRANGVAKSIRGDSSFEVLTNRCAGVTVKGSKSLVGPPSNPIDLSLTKRLSWLRWSDPSVRLFYAVCSLLGIRRVGCMLPPVMATTLAFIPMQVNTRAAATRTTAKPINTRIPMRILLKIRKMSTILIRV